LGEGCGAQVERFEMTAPRRRRSRVGKSAMQCRSAVQPLHHTSISAGTFVGSAKSCDRCRCGRATVRQDAGHLDSARGAAAGRYYDANIIALLIGSRFTYGAMAPSTTPRRVKLSISWRWPSHPHQPQSTIRQDEQFSFVSIPWATLLLNSNGIPLAIPSPVQGHGDGDES